MSKTVRIRVWDPSKKTYHLSNVFWDRKVIIEFARCISLTTIMLARTLMFLKTNTSADSLIETTLIMLDETESRR